MVVGLSEFVGDLPGDEQFLVSGVGGQGLVEPPPLALGEPVGVAADDGADPVERVAFTSAVAADLLLQPPADLVHGGKGELDHVESVENTVASSSSSSIARL